MMMQSHQERVYRPLGLTLAILAGAVLFGLWPLTKFYVAWRLNRGMTEDGAILGALIPYDVLTVLTGLLGLLVLLSAVLAWWGKPPQIRFIYQGAVLLTTFSLLGETAYRILLADPLYDAIYPLESDLQNALQCQIPFQILITIYIIWYCNRAPARAFYTQTPLAVWQKSEAPQPPKS